MTPVGPDHRRANLEQVAALAGVSRATVSRVVNGRATVDPTMRDRVERAIAETGYVPNQTARALVNRRTDAVALVASEPDLRVFGDPFFSSIIRGVSQELMGAGIQMMLLMAQSHPDLDRIERYLRTAAVDGVLLISAHATHDPLPSAMTRAGVPMVIGGRPVQPDLGVRYVDNDNVDGARLAGQHLLAADRRVIGTIAGPQDMTAGVDRLLGFRTALGGSFSELRVEPGDFTRAGGEAATVRLLEREPDLDGLFCANDLMAVGALRALRGAGRRVPQDVAVVGFDDIPLAAVADPPLTTLRQQTVLQGRAMVRLFLAMTRPDLMLEPLPGVPDLFDARHVLLPVELVVRASA